VVVLERVVDDGVWARRIATEEMPYHVDDLQVNTGMRSGYLYPSMLVGVADGEAAGGDMPLASR
jgi:hypothetical protein